MTRLIARTVIGFSASWLLAIIRVWYCCWLLVLIVFQLI